MENSNGLGGARIALLIDFDNVILGIDEPGFDIELVVNALRERGTITVSRVYGDWYRHSRHRRKLMEHGVELVEAPAFGPVIKNSADIKIALDGYEIGMTMPHINTFCLVSGDSDFLPLIKKLQGLGKQVLVICGNRFTSDMLRRNCNEFISYENLLAASYGADEDATTLEGAFALLHRAMEALRERGSEIRTSTLKQMMIQLNPVFSEKTFGYNQFRGFLDKAGREGLIKLGPRDRVSGEFYVLLPEEDEAEVIEQIERAEPAQVVEEIVEQRRSNGRGRRGERNSEETPRETPRDATRGGRDNRRGKGRKDEAPIAETEEEQRPTSRREARLQALREQEELEQQIPDSPTETSGPAPLATPLTPATDFSPADADEVREKSMARSELLARGMHLGKVKFSGKIGRAESVGEPGEAAPPTAADIAEEEPAVEPDIALSLEDAKIEDASESSEFSMKTAEEAPTDEAPEAPEATEKPKRSRSRRRRKAEAPSEEIAADEPTTRIEAEPEAAAEPVAESAPASEIPVADGNASESEKTQEVLSATPTTETLAENSAPVEEKSRRRRTSRKKAEASDETPATETQSETSVAPTEATAEAEEKPKPKRTRRRKKTDETPDSKEETMTEKAVQSDGTEQPVSTEALIEASANTPAAQDEAKPKARRRRTARKNAEEAAEAEAEVPQHIVTGDETTGEVSPQALAEIPVPVSEDEL